MKMLNLTPHVVRLRPDFEVIAAAVTDDAAIWGVWGSAPDAVADLRRRHAAGAAGQCGPGPCGPRQRGSRAPPAGGSPAEGVTGRGPADGSRRCSQRSMASLPQFSP